MGLNINNNINDICTLFTVLFFGYFDKNPNTDKRDEHLVLSQLKYLALERMTISDIESGNNEISVSIYDIERLLIHPENHPFDKRQSKVK